jgi:hypothetical protein
MKTTGSIDRCCESVLSFNSDSPESVVAESSSFIQLELVVESRSFENVISCSSGGS